ncbi:MAG: gas vesicle protein K [Alphaproteobacteria bacterium]
MTNRASGNRVTLDPNTVQHDLAKLVLSLVETIRQLLERQALRRVEGGRLSAEQIEQMGLTLMRLEERMAELKAQFGLEGKDLRLNIAGILDEL